MRADQQVILDLLQQFGAVREDQAKKILLSKYPAAMLEKAIFPLLTGRIIRRSNGYLFSRNGVLDHKIIEAIDIMLLLGPELSEAVIRGSDLSVLTFFKWRQNKLWRYDICPVAYGTEAAISAKLENAGVKYRMFVFVLEKEEQIQGIHADCEHCYVLNNNGEYEFYVRQTKGDQPNEEF